MPGGGAGTAGAGSAATAPGDAFLASAVAATVRDASRLKPNTISGMTARNANDRKDMDPPSFVARPGSLTQLPILRKRENPAGGDGRNAARALTGSDQCLYAGLSPKTMAS